MARALPTALLLLAGCGGIHADPEGREPYARYLAVREIAQAPDAPSMARLVAALEDPHFLVVVGALETFAELGRPEFLQHAAPRLGHAHPLVRSQAVATIAALRSPEGPPFLAKALKDADPSVRRAAIRGLESSGRGPDTLRALAEAVGDADPGVRLAAHEALGELTGRRDVPRDRAAWEAALK
jgi:HEAT repeat protein